MNQDSLQDEFQWLTPQELMHHTSWWEIYRDSFPVSEQDDATQLLDALERGIVNMGYYVLNDAIAAIAVVYPLKNPAFSFLHYFAVAKAYRNKGLGGKLFEALAKSAGQNHHHLYEPHYGLIWEVENPEQAASEEDQEIQARRIHFYQRHGGHMLTQPFIQPPIDGETLVPMRLMCHQKTLEQDIHLVENAIAKAIYFQKYQAVNGMETELLEDLLQQISVSLES